MIKFLLRDYKYCYENNQSFTHEEQNHYSLRYLPFLYLSLIFYYKLHAILYVNGLSP